jgi:hypothetical protein
VCGLLVLQATDAEGRWCVLYGGADTRAWISWFAGLFAGVTGKDVRGAQHRRFQVFFWRIESAWIRAETAQPDLPGTTFTWRARSGRGERIHALDARGRDIVLHREAEHLIEAFTIVGPFLMWCEEPVLVSRLVAPPAEAA